MLAELLFCLQTEKMMTIELSTNVQHALETGDLNTAVILLIEFRVGCGYSRSQQRSLLETYRALFSWSIDHQTPLPSIILDNDMDSTEGALINQALIELVISSVGHTKSDAVASLCEQMCRSIVRHGKTLEQVVQRWAEQGVPPLLLARRPYFNTVREKHFMADLGL